MSDGEDAQRRAVILDYFPQGRPGASPGGSSVSGQAHALGVQEFRLFEIDLIDDASISIGEIVQLRPPSEQIDEFRELTYEGLSSSAAAELEYAVDEILTRDEERFVDVFNDAQPITLRLHQLDLLPGIGEKLRNELIDQRKRGPFDSYEDLAERIDGLHDPKKILHERILEELRADDLKYYLFRPA